MYELVDYYADWCGPCKIMSPIIEEIAKEYSGKLNVKKVDVEAENDTAARLGVMSIPTFILFKDGKEVDRKIGAMPKEIVKNWLDSVLK